MLLGLNVTVYLNIFYFVAGGVQFSDDHFVVVFKLLGQLVPYWGQFLAVTTPSDYNSSVSRMSGQRSAHQGA